jgi:transposase-like protein
MALAIGRRELTNRVCRDEGCAVDQDGHVLDILVQRRRDTHAAKKFFRKLLKGLTYVPRVIVTDQLKSRSIYRGL